MQVFLKFSSKMSKKNAICHKLGDLKPVLYKNIRQNSALKNKRSRNCVDYLIYRLRSGYSDSGGRNDGY